MCTCAGINYGMPIGASNFGTCSGGMNGGNICLGSYHCPPCPAGSQNPGSCGSCYNPPPPPPHIDPGIGKGTKSMRPIVPQPKRRSIGKKLNESPGLHDWGQSCPDFDENNRPCEYCYYINCEMAVEMGLLNYMPGGEYYESLCAQWWPVYAFPPILDGFPRINSCCCHEDLLPREFGIQPKRRGGRVMRSGGYTTKGFGNVGSCPDCHCENAAGDCYWNNDCCSGGSGGSGGGGWHSNPPGDWKDPITPRQIGGKAKPQSVCPGGFTDVDEFGNNICQGNLL